MKLWIGAGALGIVIGGAGGTTYWQQRHADDLRKAQEQLAALQQLHVRTVSDLEKAQQRPPSLQETISQPEDPAAAASEGEGMALTAENSDQERTPEQEAERRRAFAERAVERGMERWKGLLNLRPDQIAQLENLLKNKILNNPNLDRREAFQQIQAQLMSVLTPEQKAQFDHVQNRENQARVEARSYESLFQVQAAVDLSDAQKDQLLQKFASVQSAWRGMSRQERRDQELQVLQSVLTPEQVKQYQQAQQFNRGWGGRGGWVGGR
jgi:hypothetical protein